MFKAGIGKGGLASKIAHTPLMSLGNQDLRALQELINNEKTVLTSLQRLSTDYAKAADSLRAFGGAEGEDLGDVLGQSARIMGHVSAALTVLANHEHAVRTHMKAIRTREENLSELRARRKAVGAKAEAAEKKLSKMSGEHKNLPQQTDLLNQLRDQMRSLDMEILNEEAQVGDFKRLSAKQLLHLKFGGLLEFAEKATIVGEIGKVLIEEISTEPTQPGHMRPMYQGFEKTHKLVQEVDRCVAEVAFTPPPDAANLHSFNMPMGRGSEDSTRPAILPPLATDRFGTASSHRTDNSEYMPSPVAHDIPRTSEFGEDATAHHSQPATMSSQLSPEGSHFSTFPSGQNRRADRNVSFTQSIQDAFSTNKNLSNLDIDISSGPPLEIPSAPQSPVREGQAAAAAAAPAPNPWDNVERRNSYTDLSEEERAKNHAAARDIGLSIFAAGGPQDGLQRTTSVPPPPPIPAAMPALRTPSPSVMPSPLPSPMPQTSYAPPPNPPPLSSYAPPPAPPSIYSTPAHSYSGPGGGELHTSPTGSAGGRITAAAFKRPGLRSPSGSSVDLRREPQQHPSFGLGPTPARQGTLPPYEAPQVHEPRAYAEDAYNTGSPTDTDYGALGPTRIINSDSGYAQGRFATNLEH